MAIQQCSTIEELRMAIQQLEIKQENDWLPLKRQLLATAETLKPINILKTIIGEIFSRHSLKTATLNGSLGFAAILGANLLFPSKITSRVTKMVTGAIVGVTTIRKIVNSGGKIKSIGSSLFKKLTSKQPA